MACRSRFVRFSSARTAVTRRKGHRCSTGCSSTWSSDPFLKCVFRPDVDGPATTCRDAGPVILACNHLSFSDSIFTPLIVKRRVTFVAKAEYFTGKGLKGWLMRQFFVSTGTIPVDRSGGKAAQAALDTLLRVLRVGRHRRHLPGGHPLAGRPALPRQDRRGPAGAGERRAGGAGGAAQHRRDPADRHTDPQGQAGPDPLRRARSTSPATPTATATASSSGRSPTRSCTS